MQTTAPSKFMGASGGRTVRRIKPDKPTEDSSYGRSPRSSWSSEQRRLDTMNPTSTTYSFMPKSRGNFSRLQLSKSTEVSSDSDGFSTAIRIRTDTVNRNSGVTHSAHQKIQSNTRSGIPSSMSNASSTSDRTIKAAAKNSGFAAAPEVKTAVVQTWHSAQHDLMAADVFSLAAVIMDIMTLLCKKSAGSFARHRSAKNRNAGRGGGLADARYVNAASAVTATCALSMPNWFLGNCFVLYFINVQIYRLRVPEVPPADINGSSGHEEFLQVKHTVL